MRFTSFVIPSILAFASATAAPQVPNFGDLGISGTLEGDESIAPPPGGSKGYPPKFSPYGSGLPPQSRKRPGPAPYGLPPSGGYSQGPSYKNPAPLYGENPYSPPPPPKGNYCPGPQCGKPYSPQYEKPYSRPQCEKPCVPEQLECECPQPRPKPTLTPKPPKPPKPTPCHDKPVPCHDKQAPCPIKPTPCPAKPTTCPVKPAPGYKPAPCYQPSPDCQATKPTYPQKKPSPVKPSCGQCEPGTYACATNPKTGCPGWKVCNTSHRYEYAGDCPSDTVCKFYEPSKSPYCVPPGYQFPGAGGSGEETCACPKNYGE